MAAVAGAVVCCPTPTFFHGGGGLSEISFGVSLMRFVCGRYAIFHTPSLSLPRCAGEGNFV